MDVHVERGGIPEPDMVHSHHYSFFISIINSGEVGLARMARTCLCLSGKMMMCKYRK